MIRAHCDHALWREARLHSIVFRRFPSTVDVTIKHQTCYVLTCSPYIDQV
jgi:hypothetical protein